jgi:hypothetical protein
MPSDDFVERKQLSCFRKRYSGAKLDKVTATTLNQGGFSEYELGSCTASDVVSPDPSRYLMQSTEVLAFQVFPEEALKNRS